MWLLDLIFYLLLKKLKQCAFFVAFEVHPPVVCSGVHRIVRLTTATAAVAVGSV